MTETPRFLSCLAPADPAAAAAPVALLGVPYDGAVTYRAGAAGAPRALRLASDSIESYCPVLDMDLEDAPPVDLGDLPVPAPGASGATAVALWRQALAERLDPTRPVLAVGGDHLCALPFLERALAAHPGLQILHIDAHADLRPAWDGDPFNHATVMRRVLDAMGPTARIHAWGVRSGTREEFALLRRDPRLVHLGRDDGDGLAAVRALAAGPAPVYVTLDADGLDPGALPGTGTPEPGGLSFRAVEQALATLARGAAPLVGADLVEIAPALDPSGVSSVVGARLARTLLLALGAT